MRPLPWMLAVFIFVFYAVVFFGHWIVYEAAVAAFSPPAAALPWLQGSLLAASFSFIATQIAVHLRIHPLLDAAYAVAAWWLGTLQLLVLGSLAFFLCAAFLPAFGFTIATATTGAFFAFCALLASVWGTVHSFRPRVVRYPVGIKGLPEAWKGRTAALVSDVHVGSIRKRGSVEKMVRMINAEAPDIVLLPGDFFDGTLTDYDLMTAPLKNVRAPLGIYFSEGNHEEFRPPAPYLEALRRAGVRVLDAECAEIDGLQVIGISFARSEEAGELRAALGASRFDPARPSILLKHAPSMLPLVAESGISLVVSGHTHKGQMWPYDLLVRALYGKAGHGHSRHGALQAVTTSGFGTWGPPQRIGTRAELVVLEFAAEGAG